MKLKSILPLLFAAALIGGCQASTPGGGGNNGTTKSCAEMTCDKLCKDGVCVDQECLVNSDCTGGNVCLNGLCVAPEADGCNPKCTAGVCDREHNKCVNDSVCTRDTEQKRCVNNDICVNNKCVAPDKVCDTLACDRGVCDEYQRRCVNKAGGCILSTQCLEGFYCNQNGDCTPNSCRPDGTCARGICDTEKGKCVNPTTCRASSDCVDGSECVDKGGTKSCVAANDLCKGKCHGRLTCEYDASSLTAKCVETICTTAYDCLDTHVCDSGYCASAPSCTQDSYTSAIDYTAEAKNGTIDDLKICDGETDTFTYTPTQVGKLGVTVTRPLGEVGLGNLIIKIKNENGTQVGTVDSKSLKDKGTLITSEVGILTGDKNKKYTIEVSGEDLGGTANYSIFIYNVAETAADTCSSAKEIDVESSKVVRSKIEYNKKSLVPIECASSTRKPDADKSSGSEVYTFTLDKKKYVTFSAKRLTSGTAIGLEIRRKCQDNKEIACGHKYDGSANGREEVSALLEPGAYSLIVTDWNDSKDSSITEGYYMLSTSAIDPTCTPGEVVVACSDVTASVTICNDDGLTTTVERCSNGCDKTTQKCALDTGDVCADPIVVTETTPFEKKVKLEKIHNDYDGRTVCGSAITAAEASGQDLVFKVTVPQGKYLFAEGKYGNGSGTKISQYLLENACSDLTTCVEHQNPTSGKATKLRWYNNSGASKDLYLVMEAKWDQPVTGDLTAHVWVGEELCKPNSKKCIKGDKQSITCDDLGTAYMPDIEECTFGCDTSTGECKPSTTKGDTCGNPWEITNGTPLPSQNMDQFTDTSAPASEKCSGLSSSNNGADNSPEAFYSVTTQHDNKAIEITVKPASSQRLVVWQVDDCKADGSAGECLYGEASSSAGKEVKLTVKAPTAGTYTFGVAPSSSYYASGSFEISANIIDTGTDKNKILGCDGNDIKYADHLGIVHIHSCDSGTCEATTNRCQGAKGDTCEEAKPLTGTSGSEHDTIYSGEKNVELPTGFVDNCYVPDATSGYDRFFTVHLTKDQLLKVENRASSNNYVYIQEGCGGNDSCLAFADGKQTIQYLAAEDIDVTIVVDSKTSYSTSYNFSWEITKPTACPAGYRACTSDTEGYSCKGTSTLTSRFTCNNGPCRGGVCHSDDGPATCSSAKSVQTGYTEVLDFSKSTGGDSICLSDEKGLVKNGASVVPYLYRVNVAEGKLIKATVDNISGGFGYAFIAKDNCSDLANSCLSAVQSETSGRNKVVTAKHYVKTGEAGDYIVGFVSGNPPSINSSPSGFAQIQIDVVDPDCTDPLATECDGITAMKYCSNYEWESLACTCSVTTNKCDNPKGDICQDAIPLDTASGKNSGTTAKVDTSHTYVNNIDYGRGQIDGCTFGFGSPHSVIRGPDIYFKVDLEKGDVLSAKLTDPANEDVLYVTDSCTEAGSCYASSINTGASRAEESLVFEAPHQGTYYIIVDRTTQYKFSSSYNQPQLEWKIVRASSPSTGSCVSGAHVCTVPNTLTYCNDQGIESTITCPTSPSLAGADLCSFGYCRFPAKEADTCGTAPEIVGEFYTVFNFGMLTNTTDYNSPAASGIRPCLKKGINGSEAFFKFKLPAHEKLHVTLQRTNDESSFGVSYYFFENCNAIGATCRGGGIIGNNKKYPYIDGAEYLNDTDQEKIIYLGLDAWNAKSGDDQYDYPVILHTWMEQANCNTLSGYKNGEVHCLDGVLSYCNANNYLAKYACESRCTKATSGIIDYCDTPTGNTCTDPYTFTFTPSGKTKAATATVILRNQKRNFTLPNGGPKCGEARTPGEDAVYAIDLEKGDTLDAEAVSTYSSSPLDIAIYIASSCDIPNACLTNNGDMQTKSTLPEKVSYTAKQDERVYLFIDSLSDAPYGSKSNVKVDVTVTSP